MDYGWSVLIFVSLALFIIGLDATFMNVAITYLVKDLNTTLTNIQSIIAIYALVMGCFVLFGGKLQDVIGRKKTFLSGAVIYGVGSLIAAMSTNALMLLVGWSIIEGFGAALMLPATSSIITAHYTGSKRAFALGFSSTLYIIAIAVGPLLGGYLTTFYSWRWGFALEAVMVLFILLLSYNLTESELTLKWSDINLKGAFLSSAGILLLILGVLQLNNPATWVNYYGTIINPIGFAISMSTIILGILFLVVFFYYQRALIRHGKKPFMDIHILKNRSFTFGNLSRLILALTLAGLFYIMPLYIQTRWGVNALITGLIMLPAPIGSAIFAVSVGKLTRRIKPHYLVFVGFILSIIAMLMMYHSFMYPVTLSMMDLIPSLFLLGIGLGLATPNITNIILSSVEDKQLAEASGIHNTFINVGSSIGTVALGIIFFMGLYFSVAATLPVDYSVYQNQQALNHDIYSWIGKTLNPDMSTIMDDPKLYSLTFNSGSQGMQDAILASAVLLFIGLIMSLFIKPPPENIEKKAKK
jgi:Arabinose efflux permease